MQEKVAEIDALCETTHQFILQTVKQRELIIGNGFLYDGLDLAAP